MNKVRLVAWPKRWNRANATIIAVAIAIAPPRESDKKMANSTIISPAISHIFIPDNRAVVMALLLVIDLLAHWSLSLR